MATKQLIAAFVLATIATPTIAQQFAGAEGTLKYQTFTDEEVDLAITSLSGGFEGTVAPKIGFGADLRLDGYDSGAEGLFSGTLHAMYLLSPDSAVGLFVTNESEEGFDATSYGIEAGYMTANGGIDGYFGIVSEDDIDGLDISVFGIGLSFDVGSNISIGLNYDSFTVGDNIILPGDTSASDQTFSDTSINASYTFAEGIAVFAEFGQFSSSATSDGVLFTSAEQAEYIGIGASYTFGRGTIFGNRGFNSFGS